MYKLKEKLKQELINKIKETDNPFIIECTDIDGDYAVTDEQIFRI